MIILPAIDLLNGEVVRLQQGDRQRKTVYSTNPVEFAQKWEREGGDYLHVVDLDGAFTGTPANVDCVARIVEALTIPVEIGGGIRDMKTAERLLATGVERVIVGTRAAESVDFVAELINAFGARRVAVGIDARNGIVAVKGWTQSGGMDAIELAQRLHDAGVATLIYTDIATDGMLEGPNFVELERMALAIECNVIASGGVTTVEDVRRLARTRGVHGAIIGKALFDGVISLKDAVAASKGE
jgi:phosphoribosylformimino-5-aminoimidazole carboxamide ribotide isomerase